MTLPFLLFSLALASPAPQILQRPEGHIAYSDTGGSGRPIVCIPGIGEVRGTWRLLTPLLVQAGYRVVSLDIRGQGESSATFSDYGAAAVGDDVVALMDALDLHHATVMGNSMGGAAAVWAAAERPARVQGLVLVDPFVRDFPISWWMRGTMHGLFMRPWGPRAWGSYYKSLYKGSKPADLDDYTAALVDNLREPGRIEAVSAMLFAPKAPCEKRIPEVHVPVTVVMGSADSDFDDPPGEAQHVASLLHGRVTMVDGSGHYPQVEQPSRVAEAVQQLLVP